MVAGVAASRGCCCFPGAMEHEAEPVTKGGCCIKRFVSCCPSSESDMQMLSSLLKLQVLLQLSISAVAVAAVAAGVATAELGVATVEP